MTCATAQPRDTRSIRGLNVWATADDGNHERKSEHSCANKRFGCAADTDPYGERILQRARVDGLAGKSRGCFPDQCTLVAFPDFQEKLDFFRKERIVIFRRSRRGDTTSTNEPRPATISARPREIKSRSRTPEKRDGVGGH